MAFVSIFAPLLLGAVLTLISLSRAPEPRVDVLVVWLEPISEGSAEHALLCTRGTSLHDVVHPIKKISRITLIERERLETRKRLKKARGPFPSVGDHSLDAECAPAGRECIHRRRIP